MGSKKNNAAPEKSFFEKLGDQAAHVKEELVAGKDHLVEFAGDAFDTVKTGIQEFKKRKAAAKKPARPIKQAKKAVKKVVKKLVKKSAKATVKKAVTVSRKAVRKTVKKAAPKKKTPRKSAKPAKKSSSRGRKK